LSTYADEDKHATASSPSGFQKMRNDRAQKNEKIFPPDGKFRRLTAINI
jgi:hypothetical protein